jgi:hypothetical protein
MFARADVESGSILKTAQKLCQVYVEAFSVRGDDDILSGGQVDLPKLGMYSEQQIRYIEDASSDISKLRQSIVKIDAEEAKREGAETLLL